MLSKYHTLKIDFFSFFVKLLSLTFAVITVYFDGFSKLKTFKYILKKEQLALPVALKSVQILFRIILRVHV